MKLVIANNKERLCALNIIGYRLTNVYPFYLQLQLCNYFLANQIFNKKKIEIIITTSPKQADSVKLLFLSTNSEKPKKHSQFSLIVDRKNIYVETSDYRQFY